MNSIYINSIKIFIYILSIKYMKFIKAIYC